MANLKGTNVAAAVVPFTSQDTYPTHLSAYGKGGWHEKQTIADRDKISEKRRTIGMAVYVLDERKLYILENGITNDDWVEFIGNSAATMEDVNEAIKSHDTDENAHAELFASKSRWYNI